MSPVRANDADFAGLLGLLRPQAALHYRKLRQGAQHDGGYVLLDDFAGIGTLVSCGIGDDVTFDSDLAKRGLQVHQYDHTIERSPVSNPAFHFHRSKVSGHAVPGEESLGSIVRALRLQDGLALLKIDIEGDEWETFAQAQPDDLRPFRQIVCEFHWLEKACDAQWRARAYRGLSRLVVDFSVVHVHANNYSPLVEVDGITVPSVLELSFASRRWYDFEPGSETFPTPLDRPNNPDRPDFALGNFAF